MTVKERLWVVSLCWLIFLGAFGYGFYVYKTKIWPYPLLSEIEAFVLGHEEEKTGLSAKILNDLDLKPARHLVVSETKTTASGEHRELTGLPLNPRREHPRIYLSDKAPKGFRAIYGVFDFTETRFGIILLDPRGNVANVWQVSQEDVEWEHRPDNNVYPHGFEISSDGSVLTGYDDGSALTRYDYCGNILWRIKGCFHHSISFEDDAAFWAIGKGDALFKIDYATGDIIKKIGRKIGMLDIMAANPEIDIFGIRQNDDGEKAKWVWDGGGPFHTNDVEPLTKDLESLYPGFRAGDLLVTLRSLNLVFVMDQDTLKIKWWRQGLARRPHDADWNNRGTISIFNNNMNRKFSNIVEIDPATFQSRVIVDGAHYDFHTALRGKHQIMPDGGVLITSSLQGRVFEIDKSGNMVFEFINTFDNDKNLLVSEARFVPEAFFKELPKCTH